MALTVLITTADRVVHRCAGDEPSAAWVPVGIEWGSQIPGGWKEASFDLLRRIDEDLPLSLLDEVEILDEHGETMYEGRIQQLPRQHGDEVLLGVKCMGWAAHLLDDKAFREVYVDRDLSRWQEPSRSWRVSLLTNNFSGESHTVDSDATNGEFGLRFNVQGAWAAPMQKVCDAWYDAGPGIKVASIYYWPEYAPTVSLVDVNWGVQAGVGDGDDGPDEVEGNQFPSGTPHYWNPAVPRRYATLQWRYDASPGGTQGTDYTMWAKTVAVYGDHGVAGVDPPSGAPAGFWIDDILANALGRAAPKLNWSTGVDGSIERPNVVVIQAAYPDPGSVEQVVLDLNKYVLWDWVVYDNKTFYFRPTDPDRLTWEARLDQGVHLSLEGEDAENLVNGCVVRYTLPDGTRRTAGPGESGFDIESGLLEDQSPDSQVNAHGYLRKWLDVDISFPTLDDYGHIIGSAYLAQAQIPARSGEITLVGEVVHPTRGLRPSREIRAGEYIRLSDHPDDVPRRIIGVRHTDWDQRTTVSVGSDINTVEAILEQLGVVTKVRLGG